MDLRNYVEEWLKKQEEYLKIPLHVKSLEEARAKLLEYSVIDAASNTGAAFSVGLLVNVAVFLLAEIKR